LIDVVRDGKKGEPAAPGEVEPLAHKHVRFTRALDGKHVPVAITKKENERE